jgi:hypothetical protein
MSKVDPDAETWADLLGPAMKITEQEDADEYFESLIQYEVDRFGKKREDAISDMKSNLGYYAGYYDRATMIRVEELFGSLHPILGSVKNKDYTPEELIKMGKDWADSDAKA